MVSVDEKNNFLSHFHLLTDDLSLKDEEKKLTHFMFVLVSLSVLVTNTHKTIESVGVDVIYRSLKGRVQFEICDKHWLNRLRKDNKGDFETRGDKVVEKERDKKIFTYKHV